jgi:hypothetical protein
MRRLGSCCSSRRRDYLQILDSSGTDS